MEKKLQENKSSPAARHVHALDKEAKKEVNLSKLQPDSTKEPISDLHRVLVSKPPFLERFSKSKKEEEEKEILETFCKIEVNIPLLDAIKQVPRYAKFLKELCTNKDKLRGNERVIVGKNVSKILQKKLPSKCKDLGTFTIPCTIGSIGIGKAMCDLSASINFMPCQYISL